MDIGYMMDPVAYPNIHISIAFSRCRGKKESSIYMLNPTEERKGKERKRVS